MDLAFRNWLINEELSGIGTRTSLLLIAIPCTLTAGPPSKVSAIGKACPPDNDHLS